MSVRRGVARHSLSAAGLGLLLAGLGACGPFTGPTSANHIILFIGDGMQREHEVAGSRYLHGTDAALSWHEFPVQAFVATWDVTTYNAYATDAARPLYDEASFDPLLGYDPSRGGAAPWPIDTTGASAYFLRAATDSAAAATAYSTGVKTDAGNIAWQRGDPAGGAIATISELLRSRKGFSIGVVTTVPFNHATPAAFASHNVARANYSQIADEMLGITRPDVLIGGGHPGWSTTWFSVAALGAVRLDPGWTVMERTVGVAGGPALLSAAATPSSGRKLFGIFGGSGGDFERPRPENSAGNPGFQLVEENPTLADEVQAALTVLARNPAGFFLMAEEGAIDHANHANDYAGMIGTVWQLDEAVKAANAFVDQPGDDITWSNTLVVVTADHANGLMRLTGAPALGKGELPQQTGTPWSYPGGQVTWGTTGHTNELVTLAAKGAGAFVFKDRAGTRYPGTQILDNTEVYATIMQVAGAE